VPSGGLGPTPGLSRRLRLVLQIYVYPEKAFEVTEGSNPVPDLNLPRVHCCVFEHGRPAFPSPPAQRRQSLVWPDQAH
jgi:hypothetical protein